MIHRPQVAWSGQVVTLQTDLLPAVRPDLSWSRTGGSLLPVDAACWLWRLAPVQTEWKDRNAAVLPKPADRTRNRRETLRWITVASVPSGCSSWHVLCSILIHVVPRKRSSGPSPEVQDLAHRSAKVEWRNRKKTCNGMVTSAVPRRVPRRGASDDRGAGPHVRPGSATIADLTIEDNHPSR